ncbi:MAG: hypothetical protein ACUVT7_08905 [Thermoplasmata archaeon]
MMGLISAAFFVLWQALLFLAFKRWISRVEESLDRKLKAMTSLDVLKEKRDEVVAVLRFSRSRKRAIWAFALLLISFFFAVTVYAGIVIPDDDPELVASIAVSTFALAVLGGSTPWLLFVEPYGNIRVVTKQGILKRSPWTGTSFIRWDEIRSVRWMPFLDNFFVSSTKGLFAVCPIYENLDRFASGVMENVPAERWVRAERKLRKALRGPFQP